MSDQETKAYDRVVEHAARLHIPLKNFVSEVKKITVNNPVGVEFVPHKGKTRDLLLSIIDSGRFGLDSPSELFGFLAGCNARRSGYKSSFREIGEGQSMHIQIGDSKCDVHIDSVGIARSKDSRGNNIFDFSKITEHWDRDLRPELGPLKHFDLTVLRGQSDVTGDTQLGFVVSVRKKF